MYPNKSRGKFSRTGTEASNSSIKMAAPSRPQRITLHSFPQVALLVALAVGAVCATLSAQTATATTSAQESNGTNSADAALNYLLFSSAPRNGQQDSEGATKLARLLKDQNHNHASDAVSLEYANSVWAKMRSNTLEFARQRSELARPTVNRLLAQANISEPCRKSINGIIDGLAKLDGWAMRMYNSFGDFPTTGFFEGSHVSMGSYHQCVEVEPNDLIGRPQYCSLKFQPIVPRRPKYHNILATIDDFANFTNKGDMFAELAKKAHYFYYTKLRLATCMPSKCEKADMEKMGEQIAVNTFLQFQGVGCLEKQTGFNPDSAQVFSLTVLTVLASFTLLGTLAHLFELRSYFEAQTKLACRVDIEGDEDDEDLTNNNNNNDKSNAKTVLQQQQNLLAAQKTGSILPAPVIAQPDAASRSTSKAVRLIDLLLHFSILRNAKKLFDTSTSRRGGGRSRASSLVPMRETGGSSSQSESESSSVDSNESVRANDIGCVHGLRFWTITWIVLGHTMQYTEWAGFGRAYQIEANITAFLLHPFLNATFSVDTFFLISGLLTTYVTWSITRGEYWRFNKFAFLISRYLRLTPQVLLVVLLYIVFPLFGDGPFWRGVAQRESDNCKKNWWVNALFLQSFYRQDQICNLVTWWLSIEMLYHFVSIFVIIALLKSTRCGVIAATSIGGAMTAYSCYLHYSNSYPPNMLPTLLQRYEIWDSIVLKYFWTPYPHAPAYFVGLLLGYALYNRNINQLSRRQVRLGWSAFAVCYLSILFGTYSWNKNAPYSRIVATLYYNFSQVFWALATGWAILACVLGNGGWLNRFLSAPLFVPLGRATYMTYLSHMLIVMSYPAKMNLLIEPSYIVFMYIFISNLFLSYGLGIFLTLVYESPLLHLQKIVVTNMARQVGQEGPPPKQKKSKNANSSVAARVALYAKQPVPTTLVVGDEHRQMRLVQ